MKFNFRRVFSITNSTIIQEGEQVQNNRTFLCGLCAETNSGESRILGGGGGGGEGGEEMGCVEGCGGGGEGQGKDGGSVCFTKINKIW
jgi:hypothetical protein